jgi:tryptophanyl-tRNA synthetase
MSKSLDNCVYLSDTPAQVRKKVNKIFTGRQSPTEPGDTSNALFQYVEAFITDPDRIAELKRKYAAGDDIGDGHIKAEVADAINALLDPMRARRSGFEGPAGEATVIDIIRDGTARANVVAEETLWMAKKAMKLDFFPRSLSPR